MKSNINIIIDPYNRNKLCALVSLQTTEPVKVSYIVRGKTSAADFNWSSLDYTESPEISVIGLYANYINHIDITTHSLSGNTDSFTLEISTLGQDYGDTPLNLTINILDQTLADNTLGQGWFVTSEWNGYDINGDLRITGLYPWMYGNLKIIDNSLWSALASETYDPEKHAFAPHLYNFNLIGKVAQTLTAPEGFGFHHDITTDHNGNLYVLGSVLDNWSAPKNWSALSINMLLQVENCSGNAIIRTSSCMLPYLIIPIPMTYILIAWSTSLKPISLWLIHVQPVPLLA